MELSRRDFLSSALIAGAAASLTGIGASQAWADEAAESNTEAMRANASGSNEPAWTWETPPEPITDDRIDNTVEADIVIVGAGIAAAPAALYAAEQGAKVIVLEKSGKVVNSRLHTMGFNAKCQQENGIEFDRTEVLTDFWTQTGGFQGRLSLYARFFDNSGPFIDWLAEHMEKLGSHLVPGVPSFAASGGTEFWKEYVTPIFFTDPETGLLNVQGAPFDWAKAIATLAEEAGAQFVFHTPAKQLVRGSKANGTEGRVEGVIAQNADGTYTKYLASKGVLLTTGDFFMNEEMVRAFNPTLLKCCDNVAEPGDVGDGHMMAMWCGAAMDDYAGGDLFPFMSTHPEARFMRPTPEESPVHACMQVLGWRPAVACLPGLAVDPSGRRIGPEDMPFQSFSQVMLSTPSGRMWGIFDSAWQEKYKDFGYAEVDLMAINTQEEVDKEVEAGLIQKYDTIEALCEGTGMDLATFKNTVETYNAACAAGEDRLFLKAPRYLASVDTPPFYAAEMGVMITSTRAGLKIDDNIRVCDSKGVAIEGLYAAGNTAGSFYGHVYPSNYAGSGIGHGQTFGWLAVKDMLGIESL